MRKKIASVIAGSLFALGVMTAPAFAQNHVDGTYIEAVPGNNPGGLHIYGNTGEAEGQGATCQVVYRHRTTSDYVSVGSPHTREDRPFSYYPPNLDAGAYYYVYLDCYYDGLGGTLVSSGGYTRIAP